jgi:hypothetical protein
MLNFLQLAQIHRFVSGIIMVLHSSRAFLPSRLILAMELSLSRALLKNTPNFYQVPSKQSFNRLSRRVLKRYRTLSFIYIL